MAYQLVYELDEHRTEMIEVAIGLMIAPVCGERLQIGPLSIQIAYRWGGS